MSFTKDVAFVFLLCFATVGHGYTVPTNDGPVVVDNFGYYLQGSAATESELLPGPLAAAPHDLLVVDFARFGDEGSKFSPVQVAQMQDSPIGLGGNGQRKSVVAYVSIGEASEFRTYWNTAWTTSGVANSPLTAAAPSWLGPVNPDFDESRKVRYWETGWQDLIFNAGGSGWLDQVVTQGFDGAYLDIIDAYFFWGDEVMAANQQPGDPLNGQEAARRMVDFVVAMTAHARQTNPSFFVIPQNGEFILSDLASGPSEAGDAQRRVDYLNSIAAIGIEDTYFRGDLDENNPLNTDAAKVAILKSDFLAAGKPVLVTDYVSDAAKVTQFESLARADGFIPFAAPTRALDTLGPPAPASVPGDFDGDGDVDAGDYGVWQSTFGSSLLAADANNSGTVDAADYTVWRDNVTGSLAVPEPGALTLVLGAAGFLLLRKNGTRIGEDEIV